MSKVQKPVITWDQILFFSPEQKVLRFLVSSRELSYSMRVLVSKLKGVRGLGGIQGLEKILVQFEEAGLVDFIDNRRGVRLVDEHPVVFAARRLWAVSEAQSFIESLGPISSKGMVVDAQPGSMELWVVSDQDSECLRIIEQSPVAKQIEPKVFKKDVLEATVKKDAKAAQKFNQAIVIWGGSW